MSQDTWLDYSSDKNVVKYLYQNNMTKYDKVADFRGSDTILRAEVTKFFTRFAKAKDWSRLYFCAHLYWCRFCRTATSSLRI